MSPARVHVEVKSQAVSARLGLRGVVLAVAPASPADTGRVSVGVDYSAFRDAFGGDWSNRLGLVTLPACSLTTPANPACRSQSWLPARNDTSNRRVTAEVALGASRAAPVVLAVAAAPAGSAGTYQATSLAPSGSWSVGGSAGDFTWSYPISLPPAPGELAPSVSLEYDSASVDGRVASTNNQASWIGEGWDYQPGYIERSYQTCSDDPQATAASKTSDLCWAGQVVHLNLAGHTGDLVYDEDKKTWRLSDDDGERVELLTGGTNGAHNGEHWRVTTRDGTQYYFGRNLPAPGVTATNSVWTVPVYGAHPGDPCYSSAGFSASSCAQAWRWNLDYVVDTHHNAIVYRYGVETNYYGANKGTSGVVYVRGGHLARIDYGLTESTLTATPPEQVVFTMAERCVAAGTACAPANIATKPADWPDVPYDQNCNHGAACQVHAPTFWSRLRLSKIVTQVTSGGSPQVVDTYALAHSFPDPGDATKPALWLGAITRTGNVGGTAVLPSVAFDGIKLANRVDATTDNMPVLVRYRLSAITTETGAVISVNYSPAGCAAPVRLTPASNTKRCFPVYWLPPGKAAPILDWFHKRVVVRVAENDPTGGAPAKVTTYTYPGSPAWHLDDNEVVKAKYRTYGQYRGYDKVRVRTGDGLDRSTLTETLYYRGMDGQDLPDGARDSEPLAGMVRQTVAYNGDGGPVDHVTVTDPVVIGPSAVRHRSPLPDLRAVMVRTAATTTRTALASGGWRTTKVENTYNDDGLIVRVYDHGDLADPSQATCTTTTYAPENTAAHIVGLPAEVETDAVACGAHVDRPDDVISDIRTFYDDPDTWKARPTAGDVVKVQQASDVEDGDFVYTTKSTTSYDGYGRVHTTADALGNTTTTDYSPAAGLPTTVTVTDAAGHKGITTQDVTRGLPTTTTDPNGIRTSLAYDALGRLTGVWLSSRATTEPPNAKFTYTLSKTAPSVVTTRTLRENDNFYHTSTALYDALLRPRQTQADGSTGGRIITDTLYDSRGWAFKTNAAYYDSASTPNGTLFAVTDNQVANQHEITFDGLGRPTIDVAKQYGDEKWRTTTVYGGDRTTVIPPTGGTPTTTVVDARGRTTELDQYTAAPTVSDGRVSGGNVQRTVYGYDHKGRPHTVKDPMGDVWTSSYDLLGRKTSQADPDSGTRSMRYDAADRLVSSTDARGKTLSYGYDALGRKTGVYDGPDAHALRLASWTYDDPAVSNSIGRLTASTRYVDGQAYTTAVTGFNKFGEPLTTTITIPQTEGALAGTYTFTNTYDAVVGLLRSTTYEAMGGLPAEKVRRSYHLFGEPWGMGGADAYISDAEYTPYGEPSRLQLGANPDTAWVSLRYDEHTHALTRAFATRNAPIGQRSRLDDVSYTYDPAGNVTRTTEEQYSGAVETQCFAYDLLRRMSQAWTATDSCAAAPSTSGSSPNVGGPNPYWTSWSFDADGQRTRQVEHATPGSASADTTTTYDYPEAGGPQPHALSAVTTAGPSGSVSSRFGYDEAGNTTSRSGVAGGDQTLAWDAEERLASVRSARGVTSYVYDADGNRLIRRDPDATTLYLPDTELRLDARSGTVTGTRYYAQPGAPTAVRTGGTHFFLLADRHGTAQVVLDHTAQVPTFRLFTPYGAPRGPAPGFWPDSHGFLGKPTEPVSGLAELGARSYDPVLGRFLSVDPVFDPGDPQALAGYTYAGNNPQTFADPSGLMACRSQDECGNGTQYGNNRGGNQPIPGRPKPRSYEQPGCSLNCPSGSEYAAYTRRGAITVDLTPAVHRHRHWYDALRDFVAGVGGGLGEQYRNLEDASCLMSGGGDWSGCSQGPLTGLERPSNAVRAVTGADSPTANTHSLAHKIGHAVGVAVSPIPVVAPAAIEQTAALKVAQLAPRAASSTAKRPSRPMYSLSHVDRVAQHLSRPPLEPFAANDVMLDRIRQAIGGGATLSEGQENFMRHELREADLMDMGTPYEDAHQMALRTHPPGRNYDPDVIDQFEEFGPWWRKMNGLGPR